MPRRSSVCYRTDAMLRPLCAKEHACAPTEPALRAPVTAWLATVFPLDSSSRPGARSPRPSAVSMSPTSHPTTRPASGAGAPTSCPSRRVPCSVMQTTRDQPADDRWKPVNAQCRASKREAAVSAARSGSLSHANQPRAKLGHLRAKRDRVPETDFRTFPVPPRKKHLAFPPSARLPYRIW